MKSRILSNQLLALFACITVAMALGYCIIYTQGKSRNTSDSDKVYSHSIDTKSLIIMSNRYRKQELNNKYGKYINQDTELIEVDDNMHVDNPEDRIECNTAEILDDWGCKTKQLLMNKQIEFDKNGDMPRFMIVKMICLAHKCDMVLLYLPGTQSEIVDDAVKSWLMDNMPLCNANRLEDGNDGRSWSLDCVSSLS